MDKFFNKGLKEGDKQEGLKNIEDKNEEQLNAIKDKNNQIKIISKSKIKPPLLRSIYCQEVKDGIIDGDKAEKIFKTVKDLKRNKIDYSKFGVKVSIW